MLFPQKINVVASARHANPHNETVVVQNDTAVEFYVAVVGDNGQTELPEGATYTLVCLHLRKQPTEKLGTLQADGNVMFKLTHMELSETGPVQGQVRVYHPVGGRLTSNPFIFHVAPDPTYGAEIKPEDQSIIEQVIGEGPAIIAEAKEETELNITERARLTGAVGGALNSLAQDKAEALLEMSQSKTAADESAQTALQAAGNADQERERLTQEVSEKITEVESARSATEEATSEARSAAQLAIDEADAARLQKEEVQDILGAGPVASVNGKTGVVEGLATQESVNQVTAQLAETDLKTVSATPELYGAIGNGVVDDTIALQTALNSNGTLELMPNATYKVSQLIVPSGKKINGNNAKIIGGLVTNQDISANSTTLTNAIVSGSMSIDLSNVLTDVAVNDYILLKGNLSEVDNTGKSPQGEMIQVKSITENTLAFHNGTSHSYTEGATVSKVKPNFNVNISNLTVSFLGIRCVIGLELLNVNCVYKSGLGMGNDVNTIVNCENVKIEASVDLTGTLEFRPIKLIGVNNGRVSINTKFGKDAIQLFGCANLDCSLHAVESGQRGIWLYNCRNVGSNDYSIKGSQARVNENFEMLLFDYSRSCIFRKGIIDEKGKYTISGSSPQNIEFRRYSEDCKVLDTVIYSKGTGNAYKASTKNCVIKDCVIHMTLEHPTTTNIYLVQMETDIGEPTDGTIDFLNNKIFANFTGNLYIVRNSSGNNVTIPFSHIKIEDNEIHTPTGNFYYAGLNASNGLYRNIYIKNNYLLRTNTNIYYLINGGTDTFVTNMVVSNNFSDGTATVRYNTLTEDNAKITKLFVNDYGVTV